ncbi:LemA family protein [Hoyosella sp. G463]|uniref:LemA family protein n=1 Tax=Lolliginicoccus lacisalsi TaxID=2742202 RepID=A0A927JCX8_9ACTN|nr:LemA family protein [Lolliginicoccus lacisalsi]
MKGIAVGILIAVIVLVVIVIAVLAFWVMGIYNGLVTRRNGYQNAFAQIDVQLTRRHDLIPNLVETAKGYIKHERETLEGVIQARNSAVTAQNSARKAPGDPQAMGDLSGAENQLTQSLGRMFALSEAYPDLKANQNMMQLSEELTSTENRVAFARQAFNDAVTAYNIKREVFPGSIIAGMFNFQPAALLEAEGPETREVPKISF